MPIKKEVKKQAAAKKEEVSAHKHDDLLKEIAQLKKDLVAVKEAAASLKGKCHSCCGDVANLKEKVSELAANKPVQSSSDATDKLLELIRQHLDYRNLRTALKRLGYKL